MNLSDRNPRRAVSAGSLKTNKTAAAAVAATGTGTTTQDCVELCSLFKEVLPYYCYSNAEWLLEIWRTTQRDK